MGEKLYEPVPDLDAYLDRIGIAKAKPPTLEFLDELIYVHQCTVPFDNLDVCEKALVPSLGIADLFDKIVVRKRGGYCFELNALFEALLKALGYTVRPYMARVLLRPIPYPLISHRANFVTIDDRDYIADVGFGGPQPTFAVPLEDGLATTKNGQTFATHKLDGDWWDLGYIGSTGEEQLVQRMCMASVGEEDFVPLSFFQAANPESVFRTTRMVNIKTANGALNLRNSTLTEFAGGERSTREVSEDELEALLEKNYGIVGWR